MIEAEVVTKWVPAGANYPSNAFDHELKLSMFNGLMRATDVVDSGVVPSPNVLVVYILAENQAVVDAIDADPRFSVLWSNTV